jgi:mono/diheme cytochrome c family protein
MTSRRVRLVVVPAILFLIVSGAVFVLAQLHPAKRESKTSVPVTVLTDPMHGEQLFARNCATCHGEGGEGGGIGPRLMGRDVSIDEARSTIENGAGVMPGGLVSGQDLEDVLAYLKDVLGS